MARDHALALGLDHAMARAPDAGEGALRLYGWSSPTVSFGRNEPARGLYLLERANAEGVGFVRRPTGGRAVLHHLELTYAVVFPVGAFGGLKRAYGRINRGLREGLGHLGAEVELARASGPSLPPDAGPCFRQPTEGEVTALGRKLVGSAQVKMGKAVLQHGSIILDGDQDLLRRLQIDHEPVPPPATLKSVLGEVPGLDRIVTAVRRGLEAVLGGTWEDGEYRDHERMAADEFQAHYEDSEWTWRF